MNFKQQRPTWQSFQKEQPEHKIKHLKYPKKSSSLKPFGTMCFGQTKPKLNFLTTTKEGMFGEKRVYTTVVNTFLLLATANCNVITNDCTDLDFTNPSLNAIESCVTDRALLLCL